MFKSEPPGQAGSECRQLLLRGGGWRRTKVILFRLHWLGDQTLEEERMAGKKALGEVRKPKVPKKDREKQANKNQETEQRLRKGC